MKLIKNHIVHPKHSNPIFFYFYKGDESNENQYYIILKDHLLTEIDKLHFNEYEEARKTFWNIWGEYKMKMLQSL